MFSFREHFSIVLHMLYPHNIAYAVLASVEFQHT